MCFVSLTPTLSLREREQARSGFYHSLALWERIQGEASAANPKQHHGFEVSSLKAALYGEFKLCG
jgi:hypothetical protein